MCVAAWSQPEQVQCEDDRKQKLEPQRDKRIPAPGSGQMMERQLLEVQGIRQ